MKKFRVVVVGPDGEIMTLEFLSRGWSMNDDEITFFDEHGEDHYVFPMEDVINITPI